MTPDADDPRLAACRGLAAAAWWLRLYLAGWLIVAFDLTITQTVTSGMRTTSFAVDFLPDVLGMAMMAVAVGGLRRAAGGGPFGWAAVVIGAGTPFALLDFVPTLARTIWIVPALAGIAVGIAELAVCRAMRAWTRAAGIGDASVAWCVLAWITGVGLGVQCLSLALGLAGRRIELGCAGAIAGVLLLVGGVVSVVYAVWATTTHPDVVRELARSNRAPVRPVDPP